MNVAHDSKSLGRGKKGKIEMTKGFQEVRVFPFFKLFIQAFVFRVTQVIVNGFSFKLFNVC